MLNLPVKKISKALLEELEGAFEMLKAYGSIELYVQDGKLTQITVRNIKKTKVDLEKAGKGRPAS